MIEYDQIKQQLKSYSEKLKNLKQALKYEQNAATVKELQERSLAPDFWNDAKESGAVMQRLNAAKAINQKYDELNSLYNDTLDLIDLASAEDDESFLDEIKSDTEKFVQTLESLSLQTLLNGEYDHNSALLTFHSGEGGTEAQDWCQMLVRMYTRWGERHGFKVSTLDFLDGEEAGLKSCVLEVEGLNAYGYLRGENGVHRLVRISPFNAAGKRQTSFASVEVMPEIEDDDSIEIREEDLKVDTYRSGGAGGQHVNKTESAVRITHIPTGVVVACQNERSQHQNREVAMKMLRSRLAEIKEREHLDKIDGIKGVQLKNGFGSAIRSYVFMPYTLAKDTRTGAENGNIDAVMDGDIDVFINAYLIAKSRGEI